MKKSSPTSSKRKTSKNSAEAATRSGSEIEHTKATPNILNFVNNLYGKKSHKEIISHSASNIRSSEYTDEMRNYYEKIIEKIPNNTYLLDTNCVLLGGNETFIHALGLKSPAQLSGLTYEEMAKLAKWTEAQTHAFKKTEIEVMTTGIPQFNLEQSAATLDGKTKYFMSNKVPMYNSKHEIIGVMSISSDITDRKNEIFYLKHVVSKLPGSIYWKNKNGTYLGCNDFVLDMAGMKDVVGKTDYDMPWKEYADQISNTDEAIMETNKSIELEENPTLSNGQEVIMLTHKAPLKDEKGNTVGILGISVDITERKKLEAALKEEKERAESANKAKSEFLENMRHDIRTPLTGITGFASIIRDEVTDPKIKEYVDNLTASSFALLDLLNEILEVIKINSGDIPLLKKKFDFNKRLLDVINLNKAKASYKHIDLIFDADKNIPLYLIGDSTRIHRIVLELVANALNFTDKGSVKLTSQLAKNNERGVIVKIIIEDTGIGIAPDQQQEIFMQFKRLSPAYKGIYKGAGLGLTIVKQFLDEIEGEIYVESEVGIGTKFTCLIPLKEPLMDDEFGCEDITPNSTIKSHELATKTITNHENTTESSSPNNHILVVEDQFIAAMVVKNMLSTLNCNVDVAENGITAIELAKNNAYDLIFMDIGLPDIEGYEVTKRIRLNEINKGTHIPIIALTAHVDEENKQRCIDSGMNAVLAKPLMKDKAEDILNAFIPYRKKQQEAEKKSEPEKEGDLLVIEGKLIDIEAAKKVLGEGEEIVVEMLGMLKASLGEELIKLESAYKVADWSTIKAVSHKIKGGCSYCGAMRLKVASARLEDSIKNGNIESAPALYKQMLTEIHATDKAIETKNY